MARNTRWVLAISLIMAAVVGCNGFSTDQAKERCAQEQAAHMAGACFDNSSMTQCTNAFESCGADTVISDTACPITYTCPR